MNTGKTMEQIEILSRSTTFRPVGPVLTLWRAITAEWLKMKRTLALWLTLLAPGMIAGLQFLMVIDRDGAMLADIRDPWIFITRQNLTFWTLLMAPLFVTLETALVAQLDHSSDHWKHLFALPLPRWSIYVAKLIINMLLILLSMFFLFIYSILTGFLVRMLLPNIAFGLPIPLVAMLKLTLLGFLSSWLIISIHHWVSMNWRSFVVASALGIFMTVVGIFVINHEYGAYYPWTLSAVMINNIDRGLPYLASLLVGCLGGLAMGLIGMGLFIRKEVL